MKSSNVLGNLFFLLGIAGMVVLIIALVMFKPNTFDQKALFVIGAVILFATAVYNRNVMLALLEILVTVAILTSFVESLQLVYRLGSLLFLSAVLISYLVYTHHFQKEKIAILASISLVLLAIGYSFDVSGYVYVFGAFAGLGSALFSIYSGVSLFVYKVRVQAIWMVLNIIFSVSAMLILVGI